MFCRCNGEHISGIPHDFMRAAAGKVDYAPEGDNPMVFKRNFSKAGLLSGP